MQKQKNKQNGITLIALVVTIIVLIILAGVSIAMIVGENGIITQAQRAAQQTKQAEKDEATGLSSLETQIEEALGNVYNEGKGVNVPRLTTGMTPIKFTDPSNTEKGTVVQTNSEDIDWYNYEDKKWANAQTKDGSMWVWIPRFAYKVNSSTQNFDVVFLIGTTDTYYDEEGNIQTAKRCTSEDELVDTTTGYTVHPAFTNETNINYRNGGWDKEITGFWVAKFNAGYASGNNSVPVKASSVSYTASICQVAAIERGESTDGQETARNWLDGIYGETKTAIKYPVFQPLSYGMNYISYSDAYSIAQALTENGNIYGLTNSADSHLLKNSEWGAIAYLAKSIYGLNTNDIAMNDITLKSGSRERTETVGKSGVDSIYGIPGCTSGNYNRTQQTITASIEDINSTTGNTASNGIYTWNQLAGTKASTTGTIYGIYDLSSLHTIDITSSYIPNQSERLIYGKSFTYTNNKLNTTSTKYATSYPYSEEDTQSNNYNANRLIYGDGVRETSTESIAYTPSSWYGDLSSYPYGIAAFFTRGAYSNNLTGAGLFSFDRSSGWPDYGRSFRVVLIVA